MPVNAELQMAPASF